MMIKIALLTLVAQQILYGIMSIYPLSQGSPWWHPRGPLVVGTLLLYALSVFTLALKEQPANTSRAISAEQSNGQP